MLCVSLSFQIVFAVFGFFFYIYIFTSHARRSSISFILLCVYIWQIVDVWCEELFLYMPDGKTFSIDHVADLDALSDPVYI